MFNIDKLFYASYFHRTATLSAFDQLSNHYAEAANVLVDGYKCKEHPSTCQCEQPHTCQRKAPPIPQYEQPPIPQYEQPPIPEYEQPPKRYYKSPPGHQYERPCRCQSYE